MVRVGAGGLSRRVKREVVQRRLNAVFGRCTFCNDWSAFLEAPRRSLPPLRKNEGAFERVGVQAFTSSEDSR